MRSVLSAVILATTLCTISHAVQADEPSEEEMAKACEAFAKSELNLTNEKVEADLASSNANGFSKLYVDVFSSSGQTGYYCLYDETSYEAIKLVRR